MKFYKFGIEVCDGKLDEYDGHWQELAYKLKVDYLFINFNVEFVIEQFYTLTKGGKLKMNLFQRESWWYDGQHHYINFLLFGIGWGGGPFDVEEYDITANNDE